MKKAIPVIIAVALVALVSATTNSSKMGVVNFKTCVEGSKFGKQEQTRFQEMEKQFQSTLDAKQKEANEMASKFSEEYLDTLTPEAEAELKAKYTRVNQELNQLESQAYNMMHQANYQIMQKLNDAVAKASEGVAKAKGLDVMFNKDACFYNSDALDISSDVIAEMDKQHAQEIQAQETKAEKK